MGRSDSGELGTKGKKKDRARGSERNEVGSSSCFVNRKGVRFSPRASASQETRRGREISIGGKEASGTISAGESARI